jgi:hypothetical protein
MCKEMPSSRLTGWWTKKRIIRIKWRAEEKERHKGLLTPPPQKKKSTSFNTSDNYGLRLELKKRKTVEFSVLKFLLNPFNFVCL